MKNVKNVKLIINSFVNKKVYLLYYYGGVLICPKCRKR